MDHEVFRCNFQKTTSVSFGFDTIDQYRRGKRKMTRESSSLPWASNHGTGLETFLNRANAAGCGVFECNTSHHLIARNQSQPPHNAIQQQ
jgi:hypothetical protein